MMNPKENVIFLQGKPIDRWDDIESIEVKGNRTCIVFKNNINRRYKFDNNNVVWIKNPKKVELSGKNLFVNESLKDTAEEVLNFEDKWFKVFYKNKEHETYSSSQIKIKKNPLRIEKNLANEPPVENALKYFKQVTKYLKESENKRKNLKNKNDADNYDYLSDQLEKMQLVEGCALARFLKKIPVKEIENKESFIFPFSCNYSQIQAVKLAFTNDLSVIQGPPGTGKTQTILNIVANVILQGKTVAVVSGNNEAVRNVEEKMDKEGLSFLTAFLGNKDNIDAFFKNIQPISDNVDKWEKIPIVDWKALNETNKKLEKAFNNQLKIPKIKKQIDELMIEKKLRHAKYEGEDNRPHRETIEKCNTSKEALRVMSLLETAAQFKTVIKKSKICFFKKLRFSLKHGLLLTPDLLAALGDTIDCLQNKYYSLKLRELEAELKCMEIAAKKDKIEDLKKDSIAISKNALFKAIGDKYGKNFKENSDFCKKNYCEKMKVFTKRYPVVFSTTFALQACTGVGFLYDYVVIDEASQVNIVTAAIALARARNVVFVGDKMQLPHIVMSCDIKPLKDIFEEYKASNLPDQIEYTSHSILDAVTEIYGDTVPSTLLNEHYRCDPQIIGFCNKSFYNDELIVQTKHKDNCGIKIITVESNFATKRENKRQVDTIEDDVFKDLNEIIKERSDTNEFTMGIVAPYKNQVTLCNERFKAGSILFETLHKFQDKDILIDTVHKFQGKEKTAIALTTVSDRIMKFEDEEQVDFLNNPKLINVAISRAQEKLYVIVSTEILKDEGSLLSDLNKYNEYYNGIKSQHTSVYSVFDLLYKEYNSNLESLKNRLGTRSKYLSENIIERVIDDIHKSKKYGSWDCHSNYPLRSILNLNDIKDEDDIKFIKNKNTHCDFVMFNDLNKKIRLVIEVDGKQHKEKVQKERDERKNRLLKTAGIDILRLSTDEINCQEKIEEELCKTRRNMTLKLLYLGNGSYRLTASDNGVIKRVICINPVFGDVYDEAADLILITHDCHSDQKGIDMCKRKKDYHLIKYSEAFKDGKYNSFNINGILVEAVKGVNKKPNLQECVEYVITLDSVMIYYASGFSSILNSGKALFDLGLDYALFSQDCSYSMEFKEIVECAEIIGAKHNIINPKNTIETLEIDSENEKLWSVPNEMILEAGGEIVLL
ncbi:MAG: DUF2726 domain-containing protein [Christensenellaceae bacterium]|jgi:very-short-patch-repair endonuclease/RecA/RadA recombinase|nr:DUF2726 domain-containing protein [Christensenellaceae bacterium]